MARPRTHSTHQPPRALPRCLALRPGRRLSDALPEGRLHRRAAPALQVMLGAARLPWISRSRTPACANAGKPASKSAAMTIRAGKSRGLPPAVHAGPQSAAPVRRRRSQRCGACLPDQAGQRQRCTGDVAPLTRVCVTARAADRGFGVKLHRPCGGQQESAQINGYAFQGLTGAAGACIVVQAAQPRCCAEHLFRPLRLNGQVRAPIRGLPVFYPLQAPAEACRIPPPMRQASAELKGRPSRPLRPALAPANSAGTLTSPEEGNWTCGQNLSSRRCRCAALWRPAATPPASGSSTAQAPVRPARRCSMATWSPALRSALPPTSSIARRIPAGAKAPATASLNTRPAWAACDIAHAPCPGSPRARRFAFRTTKKQGTAYV